MHETMRATGTVRGEPPDSSSRTHRLVHRLRHARARADARACMHVQRAQTSRRAFVQSCRAPVMNCRCSCARDICSIQMFTCIPSCPCALHTGMR
eukprot:7205545-Lingulodinium_polyedra.AAC.1